MYSDRVRRYLITVLIVGWGMTLVYLALKAKPLTQPIGQAKKTDTLHHQEELIMGTFVEVISPDAQAPKIVFDELKRIEKLLSKYKPESEVSKLNKTGFLKASPETFYIIKKAKEFWQASGGAFDVTIGPLMDLWGFTNKQYTVPNLAKIRDTLRLVGSDKIILQDFDNVIQFKLSGMKIDLGGIAKGYALDCAVKKLKAAGIKDCLINAGGQVYCLGSRFSKPWKVGIINSRLKNLTEYLELKNKSAATSGDDQQYFVKDKKRYAHILNPKTGYPARSGVSSVSVIADDGLTADALATAIFVLGKDKGEKLAKQFSGVEVRTIADTDVQNH